MRSDNFNDVLITKFFTITKTGISIFFELLFLHRYANSSRHRIRKIYFFSFLFHLHILYCFLFLRRYLHIRSPNFPRPEISLPRALGLLPRAPRRCLPRGSSRRASPRAARPRGEALRGASSRAPSPRVACFHFPFIPLFLSPFL